MTIVELYDERFAERRRDTAPGPWLDEKDVMLWVDDESGLPCIACRGPALAWCGYVGVPKDLEIDYDAMDVHGDVNVAHVWTRIPLTFAVALPAVNWPETRWAGFDCSHKGDLVPPQGSDAILATELVYRDREFIIEQTASLARQIGLAMRTPCAAPRVMQVAEAG